MPLPTRDEPFRRGETALLLVDMQRIWLEPGVMVDLLGGLAASTEGSRAR